MTRTVALVSAIACGAVCCVYAEYVVIDEGTWPKTWPKELVPLQKQARTFDGPLPF